jgi:hypothetical protein
VVALVAVFEHMKTIQKRDQELREAATQNASSNSSPSSGSCHPF